MNNSINMEAVYEYKLIPFQYVSLGELLSSNFSKFKPHKQSK